MNFWKNSCQHEFADVQSLCPRFYKVTTRHHILATPFHKAMQLKHENFRIYRGVSLEKIPGLGQFLPSKIAKIQIFWFHSNEL